MGRLEQMFDPEVLVELRETFDKADAGLRCLCLTVHIVHMRKPAAVFLVLCFAASLFGHATTTTLSAVKCLRFA